MSATLVLSLAGTLIALGGFVFTLLERRDRRLADEAERRDRIAQFELVRRQVEAVERQTQLEESSHEAARAADVRVKRGGRDGLGWSFDLVNAGPGTATGVKAWIVRRDTDHPVSSTLSLGGPLLAGERTTDRQLLIPLAEALFAERPPLALMLSWTDTRERERRDDHPIDL